MTGMLIILLLCAAHLCIGLLFGLAFLAWGLERVDPATRGSSWAFRLLILPGVAALWPVLALKWSRASGRAGRGEHA